MKNNETDLVSCLAVRRSSKIPSMNANVIFCHHPYVFGGQTKILWFGQIFACRKENHRSDKSIHKPPNHSLFLLSSHASIMITPHGFPKQHRLDLNRIPYWLHPLRISDYKTSPRH